MWPILGGLITGGMGLLGSMFSSNATADANQQNVAAQQNINASNQAFTERMSNTAYQRASADMKAAGLNPIAMFSSGSGGPASSPQGSQVAPKVESTGRPFENMGHIASQAISSAVATKTMDRLTEEISNLQTDRALREAQTRTESERTHLTATELARLQNMMPTYRFEGMTAEALERLARSHPELFKNVLGADWVSKHTTSVTDQIASGIGSALGVSRLRSEGQRRLREGDEFESMWGHRIGRGP